MFKQKLMSWGFLLGSVLCGIVALCFLISTLVILFSNESGLGPVIISFIFSGLTLFITVKLRKKGLMLNAGQGMEEGLRFENRKVAPEKSPDS
ncbi:MAG: hypothetical protein ACI38O_00650 [Fibrobacter intestinalis]|uniref:hypothetical protein n=1 Tax=Fibrobacter TaxID=832 RepID=UPI001179F136|nr:MULTISPECIES: hypothetical protein [Fibrobacter]MDD7297835.1 hypothetical protein [Fibrobacter intestinalis]